MPRNPNKIDYTGNFPEGFEIFSEISDPRGDGNTCHHFGEILFMAFTCIVCAVKWYELMEEFCELRESGSANGWSCPTEHPATTPSAG